MTKEEIIDLSNEEAIKYIKNLLKGREDKRGKTEIDIALEMSIKALEQEFIIPNKWIPCDKGEPDEGTECWVTVKTTDALYRGNFTKRYGERRNKGFITSDGFMWWNTALAWMPIYEPEPYRTEGSTEENK